MDPPPPLSLWVTLLDSLSLWERVGVRAAQPSLLHLFRDVHLQEAPASRRRAQAPRRPTCQRPERFPLRAAAPPHRNDELVETALPPHEARPAQCEPVLDPRAGSPVHRRRDVAVTDEQLTPPRPDLHHRSEVSRHLIGLLELFQRSSLFQSDVVRI